MVQLVTWQVNLADALGVVVTSPSWLGLQFPGSLQQVCFLKAFVLLPLLWSESLCLPASHDCLNLQRPFRSLLPPMTSLPRTVAPPSSLLRARKRNKPRIPNTDSSVARWRVGELSSFGFCVGIVSVELALPSFHLGPRICCS